MAAPQRRRRAFGQSVTATGARRLLRSHASPARAFTLQRFFKTGPGQYAEGDRFLGVMVPQTRAVARNCWALPRRELLTVLRSPWHEERLPALCILVRQFERGAGPDRDALFRLYLRNRNWMLREVGERDRATLERFLARHAAGMPRTMLRDAIEHLPASSRRRYLDSRAHAR